MTLVSTKAQQSGGATLTPGSSTDAFDTAAASAGITLTAGGANTKGAWVTLVASTAAQADALGVSFILTTTGTRDFMVDIGIGAGGSEVAIVTDVLVSASSTDFVGLPVILPIRVASGTRISARCQSPTAAATIIVGGQTFAGGWPLVQAATACTTYGATEATTRGTSIDSGAVINTKGAWTQVVASTTGAATAVVLAVGAQINATRSNASHLIDIGTGAAASEVVVVPNLVIVQDAVTDTFKPSLFGPFPLAISPGTRVSARQQCSINDAADRLLDVVLYAFG